MQKSPSKPTLTASIIIPAYNSETVIRKCITAIKSSTRKPLEIIVVDDASIDATKSIARKLTKSVQTLQVNEGRVRARTIGFEQAKGDILINVDSDIVIKKDTLERVLWYFTLNPQVSAVTGRLSKTSYYKNFSSVYKNLYMYYYFGRAPLSVTFLYGSFFAIRAEVYKKIQHTSIVSVADDTALGQAIIQKGQTIHLLKDITVLHLKYFSLRSLITNDFVISRDWAQLFWENKGWKQLFKQKTGFAHASPDQIISIVITALFSAVLPLVFVSPKFILVSFILYLVLLFKLNNRFLKFLSQELSFISLVLSFPWLPLDYFVMMLGILGGSFQYWATLLVRPLRKHYN